MLYFIQKAPHEMEPFVSARSTASSYWADLQLIAPLASVSQIGFEPSLVVQTGCPSADLLQVVMPEPCAGAPIAASAAAPSSPFIPCTVIELWPAP